MKLTSSNYYSNQANRAYFSVSQVKSFMDCEERAMAELNGTYKRPETTALLVGGYVDAYFSGELDAFIDEYPGIFTKSGDLKADFRRADEIIHRLERDKLAMMMTDGDKQKIVTGMIVGAPFKAKLDFLLDRAQVMRVLEAFPGMSSLALADGAIVDLKIVKDFKPLYREEEGRMNFIEYWRYDMQLAVYQELIRQETGNKLPCFILAATKEDVPDIRLFEIPQEAMDSAAELMLDKMEHIKEVKAGLVDPEKCGNCDYCKQTRVLTGSEWVEEWA